MSADAMNAEEARAAVARIRQSLDAVNDCNALLQQHEETIRQGLQSFVDVGNALIAIKAGRLYREAGFSTFEDYCQQRWSIGHSHRQRLMVAASTVETLIRDLPESSPAGEVLPSNERQVRPLAAVPDEHVADVWSVAVAAAGGGQPTTEQVESAAAPFRPAPDVVVGLDGKRYTPPAPAESPADERARVLREAMERDVRRVEQFCSIWHVIRDFRESPWRDEVLSRLVDNDRRIVQEVEDQLWNH